jgi:hypothetical protein
MSADQKRRERGEKDEREKRNNEWSVTFKGTVSPDLLT